MRLPGSMQPLPISPFSHDADRVKHLNSLRDLQFG